MPGEEPSEAAPVPDVPVERRRRRQVRNLNKLFINQRNLKKKIR